MVVQKMFVVVGPANSKVNEERPEKSANDPISEQAPTDIVSAAHPCVLPMKA